MTRQSVERTPVTVLTGSLGSGKTTLLRRLLADERMSRTAVVINEFGEVGLDHLLLRQVTDNAVVLQNGCICCTIRSDIQSSFRELIDGRSSGAISAFDRIILETTGLADPAPILQTLISDPMLRYQTRLSNIVCTIDSLHALDQIASYFEVLRQAAVADRLVITKTDLADASIVQRLRKSLSEINPTAQLLEIVRGDVDLFELFTQDGFDSRSKDEEVRRWLAILPSIASIEDGRDHDVHTPSSPHHGVESFVFRSDRRVDWSAFGVWLSAFVHRYGGQVLRIKGLLDVPEAPGPIVLNVVQNVIHQPVHLDQWPDEDHSSRIIFIVHGLSCDRVQRSLQLFLDSADASRLSTGSRKVFAA